MPPRERYRFLRRRNLDPRRRGFTPDDLQNWAFAIMIALLFVSCGVEAAIDAYGRWKGVTERVEKVD